ncbi:putative f-box and wd domain-containing protein [Phaeoacremonium minimum UCRPA7]|uniref:Putative f-box and wd domain-containing protein n=1 Tax=Phaeoacremonium minimum (strain UCR-PA7) TaxID=1286976 RepID=R8BPW7_PHAM7|nr:putative f-box and wd domain-containing protein [Phaeoacremonium minimum UCRPA7]EOO01428.1 putative f-box and wd domain-containing protein [Phaeoacremonium minimum UCRPA7]
MADHNTEILTHILSHLHPDSHASVALVSKRFYALVTEPHAWRMAFLRFFPGQEALDPSFGKNVLDAWDAGSSDLVRSESRYFTRLTPLASWRSEYLLRTRLLRSVARGKPGTSAGGIGTSSRSSQGGKRASAVLTYNSKLPWVVSHIHAVFSNGKKGPKVIHGTRDMCVSTVSDPTIGKVEKWGLDDPFSFAQLDEVFPNLELYGLGDGPAAIPNVMDVSQPYGMFGGEGFPGGRVYLRATGELRGRYLGQDNNAIIDMTPEVPKIPELSEAICSVWIAKSSAVPSVTQSMVGMMAGSSLGVVTTYALKYDATGSSYATGEITARWVLSPGVPIIAIKVDDGYNMKRRSLGRVWAVVLNALGEVFYLSQTPTPPMDRSRGDDSIKHAWMAGRSVSWELIDSTRREARPDEFDKNAVRGAYSPRSPSDAMNMSKEQVVAEAREIEKFLRYKPAHFRKVCKGWDMCRKLEVDFAGGEGDAAGEAIFAICPGGDEEVPAKVTRHTRRLIHGVDESVKTAPSPIPLVEKQPSIFGGEQVAKTPATPILSEVSRSQTPQTVGSPNLWSKLASVELREDWQASEYSLNGSTHLEITASGIDMSTFALLCHFEDPLNGLSAAKDAVATPTTKQSTGEIPGRRSRLLAVGTDDGRILAWNTRDTATTKVEPVRVVQTESPEISCLALSSLYVVHGGSDGLVQAWDPLASSLDPVRTLNSRSSGRVPRHIVNANPALRDANYSAVGAIFLDPDPTVLRGVLAFGTFLRYWTYSSTGQSTGRKRRLRHSDVHGRLASRRHGGTVQGYIAAEEAELRHEQAHQAREQARLRSRFGVGLGDLTEEEAIRYAQMISEEAFLLDEQRRTSASDTGSAADMGETTSSFGSLDTVTPEPSVSGLSPPNAHPGNSVGPSNTGADEEDDYEQQIQRAIRLSLMEGVNDVGQSPRGNSSPDFEFQVKYKSKKGKRSASNSPSSSQVHTPLVQYPAPIPQSDTLAATSSHDYNPDEDLELALRLSLQEEEERQAHAVGLGIEVEEEDFPELEVKGKGKGVYRG